MAFLAVFLHIFIAETLFNAGPQYALNAMYFCVQSSHRHLFLPRYLSPDLEFRLFVFAVILDDKPSVQNIQTIHALAQTIDSGI